MAEETATERRVATSVHLDAKQHRRLGLLSKATRVPMAVYVRQGVDMALEHHEAPLREVFADDE